MSSIHRLNVLINYLNGPGLVAQFQQKFGIEPLPETQGNLNRQNVKFSSTFPNSGINTPSKAQINLIPNGKPTLQSPKPASLNSENGSLSPIPDDESSSSESDHDPKSYKVHNWYWYYLFCLGTALGDEIFYASMFPCWFWNIDGAVGRRIVTVWALSMYIGQGLKDVICWPRPRCPPVVRMDSKWALEYGMPSTHALVSATVPFSVILYTMHRYEYPVFFGVAIAITWCILVSLSRLYLGMHSVLDVIAGLILAGLLLPILIPFAHWLDSFLLSHPSSPGVFITTGVTLLVIYPGSKFSSAREDTAVILGSAVGLHLGSWLSFQLGSIRGPPVPPPYSILWPSYDMLGLSLLRTIIGLIMIVATRAVMKTVSYATMQVLVRYRSFVNKGEDSGQSAELFVKLGSKFLTYGSLGVTVMYFAPAVFRYLDIERPTFHTEI